MTENGTLAQTGKVGKSECKCLEEEEDDEREADGEFRRRPKLQQQIHLKGHRMIKGIVFNFGKHTSCCNVESLMKTDATLMSAAI